MVVTQVMKVYARDTVRVSIQKSVFVLLDTWEVNVTWLCVSEEMSLIVKFVAATVLVPQLILVLVYLDILEQNVLSVNALDLTRQIPMFALPTERVLLLMIVDVTMDILV